MQKYDTLTKWKNILALTKWPKKQNPVPVSFLMYNWVFTTGYLDWGQAKVLKCRPSVILIFQILGGGFFLVEGDLKNKVLDEML